MRTGLVLGGGGVIGVAWESGILKGLLDAGVERGAFDVVVGTSAGAIVGARFLAGHELAARPGAAAGGGNGGGAANLGIDQSTLDLGALGRVFQLWGAIGRTTPAQAREIGALVRGLYREREPAWVSGIGAASGGGAWPDTPLRVSAVDTESGERRLFDRASGVDLARAIAASCAVPGLFPSVTIDARLYMDGQVHSSTHADALVPDAPARLVVLMPTNSRTAQSIGAHAERALEAELAALRAAGTNVLARTPSADDAARMGANLMDASKAPHAFDVGLATGRALASELG
jgi:NTE family protein